MELIVQLKQHTPIIHFQHDQEGATLRATELKPKLDRFIRKLNNLSSDRKLRYSITIRYISPPVIEEPDGGLFFGNQGQNVKVKKQLRGGDIELSIHTYFDHSLKNMIAHSLPVCLALENFGTRNNKGYGCFYPKDKDRSFFEEMLKKVAPSQVYYWDCDKKEYLFSIKTIYSLLKSGINMRDRNNNKTYYKSRLYLYFKAQHITWDKKAIKQHFGLTTKNDIKWTGIKEQFVRAVLGVGDVQEWKIPYDKTLKITSIDFERVPSPIVFKAFDNGNNTMRVYMWARTDFYTDVLGKKFTFSVTGKPDKVLDTPTSFDLPTYLFWAVNEFNSTLKINTSAATFGIVKKTDDIVQKIQKQQIKAI